LSRPTESDLLRFRDDVFLVSLFRLSIMRIAFDQILASLVSISSSLIVDLFVYRVSTSKFSVFFVVSWRMVILLVHRFRSSERFSLHRTHRLQSNL